MIKRLPDYILCFVFLLALPLSSVAQTADFSISPASGCAPLVVNFTDMSAGAISSYSWNLGNTVTSTQQNPSTTYTSPGTYPITLTVTGPTGSDTKTGSVTVYDKPVASFAAAGPLVGCTPHNVQFNSTVTANSPGQVTYAWDFGDGTSGTGANPAHTYATAGVYSILLIVTNGAGCVQTVVQNAYITAYPVATAVFSANQTYFCNPPATVTLTNFSSGGTAPYSSNWDFGDGGTGIGNSVSHTYATGGNFTVSLIVSDANGCTSTLVNTALITVIGTQPTMIAPTAVCDSAKATFVNSTLGHSGTSWDFGDGHTDPTSNVADHYYEHPGNYTATMTTTIAGCVKTVSQIIQVNPKPNATYSMTPPIPCPPPVTVSFSATSSVATTTSYDWSWRSGGTASGQTVSKFYPANAAHYVLDGLILVTTSAAGCKDTLNVDSVYIRNILVGVLPGGSVCDKTGVADCFPRTWQFSLEHLKSSLPLRYDPGCNPFDYPYDSNSWHWDFGDGSPTSSQPTPSHTFSVAGTYIVKAIITTPNGCVDSGATKVHVDTPVQPSFTVSTQSACQNSPVIYTNTTTNILRDTKFKWHVVDIFGVMADTTIRDLDSMHGITMIREPGNYSIFLFSDHRGCIDSTYMVNYLTINPPDAHFEDSTFCSPNYNTVKFINKTVSATSFFWEFGDGDTSIATNPTHTYSKLGHYVVTLVAYNSAFRCFDTLRRPIDLFDPTIDFTVLDPTKCVGEIVEFTPTFIGFGTPYYSFLSGNSQTYYDTVPKAYIRYLSRGLYDVTLYVASGNGCLDSLTKKNYIQISRPGVKYGIIPPIGCMPLTVRFQDSSDNIPGVQNVRWKWAFGDFDTIIVTQPFVYHTYTAVGKDTVQLIVTDTNGCESDFLLGYAGLSVHKPNAAFVVSDTGVCAYEQITFLDTSALARTITHRWEFGDGTTDTGVSPRHAYTKPGRFNVRLIVTDTVGCTDTLDTWFISVTGPHAAFTMSDSVGICPPLMVRFSNLSSLAVSYLWDFGTGGSPVVVTNPISTFGVPGVFNVMLVAKDLYGCTDTARDTVRVLGYGGAFSYVPLIGCAPLTVTFTTPLTGIPQITWDFGDGVTTTTSATTTSHTYTGSKSYSPKVIFSDGATCVSSSAGIDTIRVDQIDADFGWSVPCAGTTFSLYDSSRALFNAPDRWSWYFGGSDTAAGTPASFQFATPGNHKVTLVAGNATGCRDTVIKDVFVNSLPSIDVTSDTAVCPGDPVRLLSTGGSTYTWNPAADSMRNCPSCDIAFVHVASTTPGDFAYFKVTGTDTNGCVNSDSTKVTIQIKTTSTTGDGGEICVGESFRLHAEGAQKYEWSPKESLDSPFIASPLATPQRSTIYVVVAQEGTCLVDSQHIQVIVRSMPIFSAGQDEVISLGSAVTLKPTKSGISRIEWRADTTLTCWDCFTPSAHPYYTRTYYATGYNEYGCWSTDSVTVHVRCNGSLVFIPNSFTPNGDGMNEYFYPRGEGIERMNSFRIFDRWGELLFEKTNVPLNDESVGWNGSYRGKPLPPDVYFYLMQSTCSSGDVVQWKGDITLIR